MKKPKHIRDAVVIIFLVFMSVVTVIETLSQLKYANYSKVVPASIDSVQLLDNQQIQQVMPAGARVDIAGYRYYLMDCTIENQTSVDGTFYSLDAFGSTDKSLHYQAFAVRPNQGSYYHWYVPAGESVHARMILQVSKKATDIAAIDNPSAKAELAQE